MKVKAIFFVLLLAVVGNTARSQNIDAVMFAIFFKTDVSRADTGIVGVFRRHQALTYFENKGWTAHPPMANKNDTPRTYVFAFPRNAYFDSSFGSGYISVATAKTKKGEVLQNLGLTVTSLNLSSGDSTYEALDRVMSSYADRRWREKDLDPSYTMTSYIDKSKSKKIVLTKQKSTTNPMKDGVKISVQVFYLKSL